MSTEALTNISAFVICMNEESQIRRCLESVKWCPEIVVIDSGSTDRTLEICREYTQNIHHRGWTGYVDQKRFGIEMCSKEWILNIDADEEVSPQLRDEILALIAQDSSQRIEENGLFISRVVHYLGRWWRSGGWYPEYRLRLCRRSHTTWGGDDPHEKAVVEGPTRKLRGELYHYTYRDIADQIDRLNKFSSAAARTLEQKGATFSLIDLLLRPLFRFCKFYLLKGGYRDGIAGLIVALQESNYVLLKYAKLWERQRACPRKNPTEL